MSLARRKRKELSLTGKAGSVGIFSFPALKVYWFSVFQRLFHILAILSIYIYIMEMTVNTVFSEL